MYTLPSSRSDYKDFSIAFACEIETSRDECIAEKVVIGRFHASFFIERCFLHLLKSEINLLTIGLGFNLFVEESVDKTILSRKAAE